MEPFKNHPLRFRHLVLLCFYPHPRDLQSCSTPEVFLPLLSLDHPARWTLFSSEFNQPARFPNICIPHRSRSFPSGRCWGLFALNRYSIWIKDEMFRVCGCVRFRNLASILHPGFKMAEQQQARWFVFCRPARWCRSCSLSGGWQATSL